MAFPVVHPPENLAGIGYPELYEVQGGVAHFLLQAKSLDDIILIEAQKGDIIAIPPGYGHVTINPSPDQTLTMANLVSTAFASEYAAYDTMHGARVLRISRGCCPEKSCLPGGPAGPDGEEYPFGNE